MRVVVTGGGTGGHIFPAIAVCEAIKRCAPDSEILYIGGTSGMETEIVPATGISFQTVTARKMPVSLSIATARGLMALAKGYAEARTFLKAFRADVVVGTGGYVAAATVKAASGLGIPTVILENNLVAGRTNLNLGAKARAICVSFEETMKQFPSERCTLTGLPLRDGIVAPDSFTKQNAIAEFDGFRDGMFTLIVIGGSQGARAINNLVLGAAPGLLASGIQILHQAGTKNIEEVKQSANAAGILEPHSGYLPIAFIDSAQMPAVWRAADLALCRGGISTLSEGAVNGKPMLIVPLPTAYADHQTANARTMEQLGGAIYIPESELTAARLAIEVLGLKNNPKRLAEMASASTKSGRPNAADEVAKIALAQVK